MPFCPKCGKEAPSEAVICSSCGSTLKVAERGRVRWRKYLISQAGVSSLVVGMIVIFMAVAVALYGYGQVQSALTTLEGKTWNIKPGFASGITSPLLTAQLLGIVLGAWGGFYIGRYVQTEFAKRGWL